MNSCPDRVLAMTLFFLGCWLTGLPAVPFFKDPFLASSRCFSTKKKKHQQPIALSSTSPVQLIAI